MKNWYNSFIVGMISLLIACGDEAKNYATISSGGLGGFGGKATNGSGNGGNGGNGGNINDSDASTDVNVDANNISCYFGDYPNPLLSCNPQMPNSFPNLGIIAAPGEFPNGAAVGRFGPTINVIVVSQWIGYLIDSSSCTLPDPVEFSIWTEPGCNLPTKLPVWQSAPLSEFTIIPLSNGIVRLSHQLNNTVWLSPAGKPESGFSAIRLTTPDMCVANFIGGEDKTRAIWLGLVDKDHDGQIDVDLNGDPILGYEFLQTPSAPIILPFFDDLGFGAG